jgi:hypothetical protein
VYDVSFIDDFSRNTWMYSLKNKLEVFDRFKEFNDLVENQREKIIKVLRMDNGGEFCENEFKEFCKKCSVESHNTIPYTPQENGFAERMNTTLMKNERCMLSVSKLGHEFDAEAMGTTCYLVNRSPSSALDDKNRREVQNSKKPSLTHIEVFGCDGYVQVPKENKSKLDKNDEISVFIGYKYGLKGYKIWYPETNKVVYSRDLVFIEIKDVIK